MKYLFILGRNIELSVLEIKSFLEKENFRFKEIYLSDNGLLIEIDGFLEKETIEKVGGVISIGKVLAEGGLDSLIKELDSKEIYETKKNKLNYVIHNFKGDNFLDIGTYLKRRFKDEGLKSTEKNLNNKIKLQEGKEVPNVSSKLVQEEYFVFRNTFGRIIEKTDFNSIESRDMNKPVRRSEFSISPRLAKILINLSQAKKGDMLLDPFCGIGVILQEALLQEIKVVGIDKDKNAISSSKSNLEWFGFNKEFYKLFNLDSSKISIQKVSCIATEPYLGELQKKCPSPEKIEKIMERFESLMIKVLKNLKKHVGGRIVFVSPLILTRKKRISCNIEKICSLTGLKLVFDPIPEYREGQIMGRSIVVASKK